MARPRNTPDVPSPLVHDGLAYLCREDGDVICLDAKTGKEIYHKQTRSLSSPRLPHLRRRQDFSSIARRAGDGHPGGSPVQILAKNELGEQLSASPAVSNGRLYFRTFENLWAVGIP